MAKITYQDKVDLYENTNVQHINKVIADDMNEIKDVINDNETKVLIAVSDTAPSTCAKDDLYYNTTQNKIFVATATNTWSSTGTTPTENTIYILFDTKTTYSYDGNSLVSIGGGEDEIAISTSEPTEHEKLWVNPNQLVKAYGTYISNTHGSSQTIGYSQEYVNRDNTYSTSEIKTNKVWIDGKPIYRIVLDTTDTNSTSNWKQYNYSTLGIPSGIDTAWFPEAYSIIVQENNPYVESFYSQGTRIQTSPATAKINILGNGTAYSRYIIIMEYTKTTD